MKKQFFYAALAIGMMSSCTSSDLPGNQAPEEQLPEEERVAIELGISSPNAKIEASTKGIGSVGSTETSENKWKGETLGVWMYKVTRGADGAITDEDPVTDLDGLKFQAPVTDDAQNNPGKIRIISDDSGSPTKYKYVYYPSTGAYSFYGFHLDGADNVLGETPADVNKDNKTIKGLIIDGTQDIMTAGTMEVSQEKYAGTAQALPGETQNEDWWTKAKNQSFSAWSARRGIQPTLVFEHQLARLRFFVKAGDASAAAKKWDGAWTDRELANVDGIGAVTKAVQITGISIEKMAKTLDMQLSSTGNTLKEQENSEKGTFVLMQKPSSPGTDRNLEPLQSVSPEYWADADGKNADDYKPTTQVGESILFLPVSSDDAQNPGTDKELKIAITVKQAVVDTYTETTIGHPVDETWIVKENTLTTTLKSSTIVPVGSESASPEALFKPGNSYDIIITVYSYSKIEISAQLTKWENGGSINTAPGDEF
ncbi:MAG: hypothetical protein SOW01_08700 [Mediterranea sp.]|nr:hypothetical protein [Mediterranea sp.]